MLLRILLLAAAALGTAAEKGQLEKKGLSKAVSKVVVFGDSYSDTGYMPTIWPYSLGLYLGVPVYSFAKAGATCSNDLTPRVWPDVVHDELPLYAKEAGNGTLGTMDYSSTVFTLWIGTNDVGAGCMLTGDQTPGVTIVDTTACAVNWVKTLYDGGARNFLFQNMVPLYRSPVYKPDAYLTRYWTLPRNATEFSLFVETEVKGGNKLAELMLKDLVPTLTGAHIGIFDSHGLFNDIIDHPAMYLNGTAPLNVTSAVNACPWAEYGTQPLYCTTATGTDADSFVWDDELHPSAQAHKIVAREIAAVLNSTSTKWVNWLS